MGWKKRRVLKLYARRLPGLLRRDYGEAAYFTPQQIKSTLARYRLNTDYMCYALSQFSDRTQFDAYHDAAGERCDYQAMRMDMIEAVSSNWTFSMMDFFCVVTVDQSSGHHAADHGGAAAHHAGHHGGDGGGGHGH